MLDLFSKSLDLLLKLVGAARRETDRQLRREFGKVLVTAYFRLLEVISTAKRIVDGLERASRERSLFLMPSYLKEQAVNLLKWDDALRRMRRDMLLLGPQLGKDLRSLYGFKFSAIEKLARICQQADLPLAARVEIRDCTRMPRHELIADLINTSQNVLDNGQREEIDDATLDRIEQYLEAEKPRSRIEALEEAAEQIREFLVDHFTLDELLWSSKRSDDCGLDWLI